MEKTGYKFSVKTSQSLTSGVIGLECYFAFDQLSDFNPDALLCMLQKAERKLTKQGYRVASVHAEKIPKDAPKVIYVGDNPDGKETVDKKP